MAEPCGFDEANTNYGPPAGMTEQQVSTIRAHVQHASGGGMPPARIVTTCWKLSAEELEEIKRTGRVWFRSWGGLTPHWIGGIKPEDMT